MRSLPRLRWCHLVLCLATIHVSQPAHAQTDVSRGSEQRAAGQAATATTSDSLSVYLMTMGQGDQVWEKFGHNAIGVRDARAGTDIVYNWGMFSFDQPGFIPRFLRGLMTYWMAPFDASQTLMFYIGANRTVTIQELNLTTDEKVALRDFLAWNALDENKFYRYDYFRDNCSTRARDALDRVLHGELRRQLEPVATTLSYRDHALRLTQDDWLTSTGIDIGLGLPTDRHLSAWEEGFIPMSLRDRLRAVRIQRPGVADQPLVRAERTVFLATRQVEPATPANRAPLFFLVSAALALVVVILATRATRGLHWARALVVGWTVTWGTITGLLGVLLTLLWTVTEHVSAYRNMNLFHLQPVWLVVAVMVAIAAGKKATPQGSATRLARVLALTCGVLSVVGFVVLAFPGLRQGFGAPVALTAPLNLATVFAITRLFPAAAAPRA